MTALSCEIILLILSRYDILLPHGQMSDVLPDGGEGAEDAEDVD